MSPATRIARWSLSALAFLTGLVGVIWWQVERDRRLLEEMDEAQPDG